MEGEFQNLEVRESPPNSAYGFPGLSHAALNEYGRSDNHNYTGAFGTAVRSNFQSTVTSYILAQGRRGRLAFVSLHAYSNQPPHWIITKWH